jgi:hypothetical protein
MIHISSMDDFEIIRDNVELWRECYGYLSVCAFEITEYGDEEDLDGHDFGLSILEPHEAGYIDDLGSPEESALIRIESCGEVRMFRRLVYPSEIRIRSAASAGLMSEKQPGMASTASGGEPTQEPA